MRWADLEDASNGLEGGPLLNGGELLHAIICLHARGHLNVKGGLLVLGDLHDNVRVGRVALTDRGLKGDDKEHGRLVGLGQLEEADNAAILDLVVVHILIRG